MVNVSLARLLPEAQGIPLTLRLLRAAEILLYHGEYIDCLVGDAQEAAWLEGAAQDRSAQDVSIRHWFDGEWERTVPLASVRLPGDVAARLEAIAREVGA